MTLQLKILVQFTKKKKGKGTLAGPNVPTYLVDIIFSIKGKGKGEDIVLLVVWAFVVEDILWRDPLPVEPAGIIHDQLSTTSL